MAHLGIDKFKDNFQGGARGSLYQINMAIPASSGAVFGVGGGDLSEELTYLVKATSLPASTVAELTIPFRGRDVKIAGKRTFDAWNMTVINDQDLNLRAKFEAWSNAMTEHGVFFDKNDFYNAAGSQNKYMCDLEVIQLDMHHLPVRSYDIKGAWPTSLGAISLSSETEIEEFEVSLSYQYWQASASIPGFSQVADTAA